MLSLIEKLQKKSEATRRKILYATVFACAAVIFGIWITTLPARLAGVSGSENKESKGSPMSSLKEAFGGIFSDFSASVSDIKEQTGAIRASFGAAENTADGGSASSTGEVAVIDNATTSPQAEEMILETAATTTLQTAE
ncbi:MAG: hypothetical protein AAB769_00210 [Patescibacteria group bacterium]